MSRNRGPRLPKRLAVHGPHTADPSQMGDGSSEMCNEPALRLRMGGSAFCEFPFLIRLKGKPKGKHQLWRETQRGTAPAAVLGRLPGVFVGRRFESQVLACATKRGPLLQDERQGCSQGAEPEDGYQSLSLMSDQRPLMRPDQMRQACRLKASAGFCEAHHSSAGAASAGAAWNRSYRRT